MKTIKVKDEVMHELIETGSKLDAEIKLRQVKLKEIKEDLETYTAGKYITENGKSVTISESPKFSEIKPEEAKKALRAKRLGKNFSACTKIVITVLQRFLSDQELGTLRTVESYTRKYSFK